jgi:EAL and modified HD-GYP domain-containing signal transduction protein
VAPGGRLAGFEFHCRRPRGRSTAPLPDVAEALHRASVGNLLGAMRLCTSQGLQAVAEVPLVWLQAALAAPGGESAFAAGMQLLVLPPQAGDAPLPAAEAAALAERLRAAGVRLGWSAQAEPAPLPGAPDVLRVPMPAAAQGAQRAMASRAWQVALIDAAGRWPGVPLLLLDLADVAQMEALLAPPVALAACAVGLPQPEPTAQALPPQAQRLLGLMNRLVRDDDNALVVADIKADVALSLRLLQHLNSAGASPGRVLDSIEQVVQVLGRDALYRWVAQLLVRQAPARPAGQALQAMALSRARLMELLARAKREPNPGGLYLLGLASMLPLLLRCRLEDAVASMQLPPLALQALRAEGGGWEPYLMLAMALERNDLPSAEVLAQRFGGLSAVMALSARAWLPG